MNDPTEQPDAREQFFRQFSRVDRKLYGYILALVLDVVAAEDIFQETCVILWKEFPRYDRERSFLNWSYGIAFNQIRKYRRKFQNKRLLFSDTLVNELAEDVSRMVEEQSQRQLALTHCLQKLTERERDLLDDYYGDQQTAASLAERGKCSVHTIYKTIKKLRRALYECVNRRLSSEVHRDRSCP
ncbi:sigma-70 family RNA polymerase sigma factor [Gimesia sp.]|uniref:sigma-70 family RNA polymerase sigma factor n=1 Tax=Gimesia sp. TaxID=2024833 RepID=UPI003A933EDA